MDSDNYFEVLSANTVEQHLKDIIQVISTILEIPKVAAYTMLKHFNWNKEDLLEQFYDDKQGMFFNNAKIVNLFAAGWKKGPKMTKFEGEDCSICCMTLMSFLVIGLDCDHRFCLNCWNSYLSHKIMDGAQTITCAAYNCNLLVVACIPEWPPIAES